MAISFKGAHFPKEVILMGVRWYVAYPLSTRHVEELMEERGVEVDHSTINRWVIKYSPLLEEAFHRRKRQVWVSWRMDETYIKVKGQWRYLYRAVDKPTVSLGVTYVVVYTYGCDDSRTAPAGRVPPACG
jgi:putative transposase